MHQQDGEERYHGEIYLRHSWVSVVNNYSELHSSHQRCDNLEFYLDRHGARIPSSVPFVPPPSPLLVVRLLKEKHTKPTIVISFFFSRVCVKHTDACKFSAHHYCYPRVEFSEGVVGVKKQLSTRRKGVVGSTRVGARREQRRT